MHKITVDEKKLCNWSYIRSNRPLQLVDSLCWVGGLDWITDSFFKWVSKILFERETLVHWEICSLDLWLLRGWHFNRLIFSAIASWDNGAELKKCWNWGGFIFNSPFSHPSCSQHSHSRMRKDLVEYFLYWLCFGFITSCVAEIRICDLTAISGCDTQWLEWSVQISSVSFGSTGSVPYLWFKPDSDLC